MIGTILGEKYRIEALLGSGGMGEVYRALQIDLDRHVAVKVVRGGASAKTDLLHRFEREARAVARLRHPHIVAIHDYGVEPGVGAYLVMELLDGRSLRDELREKGRIAPHEAIPLFVQICAAVEAAHTNGIVHRDLKPDNVIVEHGVAKVLDFGVAKMLDIDASPVLTYTGAFLGTPAYASPEVCEGWPVDARSDVYSLGCMLYEVLTGRPPFEALSLLKLLNLQVSASPTPPGDLVADLPPGLERVVLHALEKSPERRPSSASAFARELEEIERGACAETIEVPSSPDHTTVEDAVVELGNLPAQTTRFIGRSSEVADVAAAFREHRIVTLAGPGGIGKTRLAIEAATRLAASTRDGVWFVQLAAISEGAQVERAVADALAVREEAGKPLSSSLVERLRQQNALLVVDNCEHVVKDCAALVSKLASRCPHLRILTTSREVLGVQGEVVRQVPPLALAPAEPSAHASEAIQLFVDRARHVQTRFTITEANRAAVEEICQKLEGIPLAIELAAARLAVLSPQQICDRLEDRFRLLKSSSRSTPGRQQTLRAAIDWSHDLLTDAERAVFRRLSAFAGGCSPDAAEAACEFKDGEFGDETVLDLLETLTDKSLVVVQHRPDGDSRLTMLETIRHYAADRLCESGEEATMLERHRAWFERFAAELRDENSPLSLAECVARLGAEADNLRRALQTSLQADAPTGSALRLATSVSRFWYMRGLWSEGREAFERAFAAEPDAADDVRASALHDLAGLEERLGEYQKARTHYNESLALQLKTGDRDGAAHSMHNLGVNATDRGEYEQAREWHQKALALFQEMGHKRGIAMSINGLGVAEYSLGNLDRAVAHYEESLAILRELGNVRGIGIAQFNLGGIALETGDLATAESLLHASLAAAESLSEKWFQANVLHSLAILAKRRDRVAEAIETLAKAVELRQSVGDEYGLGTDLAALASCALGVGRSYEGVALREAATRILDALGASIDSIDSCEWARDADAAKTTLSDVELRAAKTEGRALTPEQAAAEALALASSLTGSS